MKTDYKKLFDLHIAAIREIIEDSHSGTDRVADFALDKLEKIDRNYTTEAKNIESEKIKVTAIEAAERNRNDYVAELQLRFSELRAAIGRWATEAPPAEFVNLINLHKMMDMNFSVEELSLALEAFPGNYAVSKTINRAAAQQNLDFPFVDIDRILTALNRAESDAKNAIESYPGKIVNNTCETAWISKADPFTQAFAAGYLDQNTSSLKTLEDILQEISEPEFKILLSERDKLETFFKDTTTENERVAAMKDVLSRHPELDRKLFQYDRNLYLSARKELKDEAALAAKAAAEKAAAAAKEKENKAVQSAKATADFFRAENMNYNAAGR